MKLLLFNNDKLGVYKGDKIVDVSSALSDTKFYSSQDMMNEIIANFQNYKSKLQDIVDVNEGVSADSIKINAPLPYPNQLVAMAVNYMEFGHPILLMESFNQRSIIIMVINMVKKNFIIITVNYNHLQSTMRVK